MGIMAEGRWFIQSSGIPWWRNFFPHQVVNGGRRAKGEAEAVSRCSIRKRKLFKFLLQGKTYPDYAGSRPAHRYPNEGNFHKRNERNEIPKLIAKTQHTYPFLFGTEDPLEPLEEIRVHNAWEPAMKETSLGLLGLTPLKNVFGPNKDQARGTQEAQTNAASYASQHRTSTLPEGTSKQSK